MPLSRLIYYSHRRIPPREGFQAIKQILDVSIRNNRRSAVTGYMVFDDRIFAQVLEGEPEAVQSTYARIGQDRRHGDLVLLDSSRQSVRAFPDWAMGATLWLDEMTSLLSRRGLTGLDPERLGAGGVLELALALHAREAQRKKQAREKSLQF
ncbi:BLUF domain-containing protein [Alsobacter sp. KACC 23698]|uniref:BLUF domain-containing protein n=1 Tax=Alsobacter sp. KACC 23698 TaxID=3149229 RepID=A0AAU7JBI3_9HYPH